MARNLYFSDGYRPEQLLHEDLIVEAMQIYGHDLYYMPRDLVNVDSVFKEDPVGSFNSSYKLEMYVENLDGFDGEGDLFSKFGVEIRDSVTLVLSKRRWNSTVLKYDNEITTSRPLEGDLVYAPFAKKLFQIQHVEHEQPFYQLNNLPIYKLRCELFEYNDENIDTGVPDIDQIELDHAYKHALTVSVDSDGKFVPGETITFDTLSDGTIMTAQVATWNDSDNMLNIIQLGTNNGTFKEPATGYFITGDTSTARAQITKATESADKQAQNDIFSIEIEDFVDFSETNPFGEIAQSGAHEH